MSEGRTFRRSRLFGLTPSLRVLFGKLHLKHFGRVGIEV